jgi:hypothetical protein
VSQRASKALFKRKDVLLHYETLGTEQFKVYFEREGKEKGECTERRDWGRE